MNKLPFLAFLVLPVIAGESENLSFMTGCWVTESGEQRSEEMWMEPFKGSMAGIGRTSKNGQVTMVEYMQVREEEGELVFRIVLELDSKSIPFKAKNITPGEVIFENPQHDFPQRVIYRKQGPNGLHARIEGTHKGQARGIDFPMKRKLCDQPSSRPVEKL